MWFVFQITHKCLRTTKNNQIAFNCLIFTHTRKWLMSDLLHCLRDTMIYLKSAHINWGNKTSPQTLTVAAGTFYSHSTHIPGCCHVWRSRCYHCEWATVTSSFCDVTAFLPNVVSFLWKPWQQRSQGGCQEHHSDLWRPLHNSQRWEEKVKPNRCQSFTDFKENISAGPERLKQRGNTCSLCVWLNLSWQHT